MRFIVIAITGLSLMAVPAMAKPPLREVAVIDDALLDLGIADRIRKSCPTISARMLKAVSYVWDLKAQARALGYSEAEIEAYVDSEAEKDRMRARGRAFFKAKGVDTSDPQSYCALGRAEIQKSSRIGSLLKAK
ncbi:DUF5333 domain-containing protein [Sulfitobacter mediterraneus]|jgi:uncharacterized protein DUF5333|uniref:DUF5333 domain-containing protein n=1 Tax=Sulfitobacter TaxID=60136 RepID=UPI001933543C|nr:MULTISPECIES: DUF5333 domain-containing protein [Sulfitobacter]MBM1632402.1 DUF5333 domain-containing protein [Sulfitobacter mediterraneus]MBM1640219.1 DUF5333 domain-containing protein [Sulfitobacter mediterraneus]MBM1644267.1 DUF5333 domain-containing protein [Sulfitobacter mediterraneus]MBM1648314.1 DUF5333 domain-containing protein [Sulfitobacter mediterraneus]MBM1652359.1 DUF5333 domain-containing protein [Sulfitobacter mediterraneus]